MEAVKSDSAEETRIVGLLVEISGKLDRIIELLERSVTEQQLDRTNRLLRELNDRI